ncbi:MAG TPA: hypothetical protein VFV50_07010, partial [Bdellovibrionales bacterium]|nr:hypothetical protein [Bdellovibrionales bacterium]
MDWPTQLDEFESLIKQGRGAAVKKTLMKMSLGAVPRTHYGRLGNIATRAGYPQFTLKLFTREIKKSSFEAADLSVLERAEYAFALTHIGAFPEAQRILERLEPSAYSKVLLYETYALFNQWRYRDAIPQLEKFLELADDRYFHRVGRVNLCAALIFCHEHARALDILRELEREI